MPPRTNIQRKRGGFGPGTTIKQFVIKSLRDVSFSSQISLMDRDQWKLKVVLTGKAPEGGLTVVFGTSDPGMVPLPSTLLSPFQITINPGQSESEAFTMPKVKCKDIVGWRSVGIGAFDGGTFKQAFISLVGVPA